MGAVAAIAGAAAHYPPLRELLGPWLILPGEEVALACLGALILLGLAQSERRRSVPLLTATILVFLVLITPAAAALGWRCFGQAQRANFTGADGALRQTSGITCGPAAAAMLLHRSGIRISEGEMAELAHTNPLQGTAPHALARAVDRVARRHGLRGRIRRVDYAGAGQLGRPFVALVNRPGVGRHALCVLEVEAEAVATIDPLTGSPEKLPRTQFLAEWDPLVVWVAPSGE